VDEDRIALHEIEATAIPHGAADPLEMVGQQQIVVGEPQDHLAPSKL
jgi:hypothetical protein